MLMKFVLIPSAFLARSTVHFLLSNLSFIPQDAGRTWKSRHCPAGFVYSCPLLLPVVFYPGWGLWPRKRLDLSPYVLCQ